MKSPVFWPLLAVALLVGCKRHEPGANAGLSGTNQLAADAAPPSPRGPGPMPYNPSPTVIPQNADVEVTLQQLSQELRNYVVSSRSVPKTFDEFVAKSHLQAPPPPAGKKFAIQKQEVVLVKR